MTAASPRSSLDVLGERVRALRVQRGWSQMTLSKRAGVAQTVISRLELGRALQPTYDVITKIAAARSLALGLATGDEARATRAASFIVNPSLPAVA